MKVPFVNLKAQYAALRPELDAAIMEVLESAAFAGGPFVAQFEQQFAGFCECPHAIGLGSGTDALWLTLLALGVRPGDEVITVPNTFIATAEAVTYCGAKPVFVDADERTYTMAPAAIEAAITPRTRAILPVHLYGQTADMDPILEVARKHGLPVVEDACQAHGARYKGKRAGSLGDAGCFSFYPGKNLGAFGEAGAVVTRSQELADRIRTLRDHGQARKYVHSMIGWNARMDGIQGAVLGVKLAHLEAANCRRQLNAKVYAREFRGSGPAVRSAVRNACLPSLRRAGRRTGPAAEGAGRKGRFLRRPLPGADPSPASLRPFEAAGRIVPGGRAVRVRGALVADVSRIDRRTGGRGRRHGPERVGPTAGRPGWGVLTDMPRRPPPTTKSTKRLARPRLGASRPPSWSFPKGNQEMISTS
jgi:dTDP-4-amino-4,6-dideoxygalactose transaminase